MAPPSPVCFSCARELEPKKGRCQACGRWQPEAAWDRALYYGFALLTAASMAVSWWLRWKPDRALPLSKVWEAWLHPLVTVPLALTVVFALRLWRRR
jgi:hypothetical protein